MHHIYQTEGIILGGVSFGEANRRFQIFTEDLGMIFASATGTRLLKSKLRYSLQSFCFSAFVFVKGKSGWRVINSQEILNLKLCKKEDDEKFKMIARIFSLLRRLVFAEEKNKELYIIVKEAMNVLQNKTFAEDDLKNFECILVLRILKNLGYLGDIANLKKFTTNFFWDENLIFQMKETRKETIAEINKSLAESHL